MMKIILCLMVSMVVFGCAEKSPENGSLIQRFKTEKSFDDVTQELEFAITERNFRITGRNTVGKGLRKRGYEDYPDIEVIHFCSLDVAKEVLDIDPGFVAQMPCRITVHEENEHVIISLILLPTDHKDPRVNEFARKMNVKLHEIVDYVLEDDADPITE